MARIVTLTRGDTRPILVATFQDEDGNPLTLAADDVVIFRMWPQGGGSDVLVKEVTADAANNRAAVTFAYEDLTMPAGLYEYEFALLKGGFIGNANVAQQTSERGLIRLKDPISYNYLLNPSFEQGLTAVWVQGGDATGRTITAATDRYRFGAKSAYLYAPAQGVADKSTSIVQTVNLIPLQFHVDYVRFSAYVMAWGLEAVYGKYRLYTEYTQDGGTWTRLDSGGSTFWTTVGAWNRIDASGSNNVPTGTVAIRVIAQLVGGGNMYVDGCQLEPGQQWTPFRNDDPAG